VGGDFLIIDRFVLPAAPAILVLAAIEAEYLAGLMAMSRKGLVAAFLQTALVIFLIFAVNLTKAREWLLIERPYGAHDNLLQVRVALAIQRVCDEGATIAVGAAGTVPYFLKQRCC